MKITLEQVVRNLCHWRLGREPNLENPTGYNDKIQWLKLNDQMPIMVQACDKLGVRDLVPQDLLIPFAKDGEYPRVVKCTHDSGGTLVVRSPGHLNLARQQLTPRLLKPYGVDKGEWAYGLIDRPCLIEEQYIDGGNVDYKFHCVHGRIAWIQVIWDRATGIPKECILTPDLEPARLHMDEKMVHVRQLPSSINPDWSVLSAVAQELSAQFRYVRVDLYWHKMRPYFGELTFWPRSGCYKSRDEAIFGELLNIDTSYKIRGMA